MIKGIIFDFDGLIVDTESVWYESYQEFMQEKYGAEIELHLYSQCIGTTNEFLNQYFQSLVTDETLNCSEIHELTLLKFKEKMKQPALRAGVLDYIQEAKKSNLAIGLASSSSKAWVTEYLKTLQIYDYFDVINTRDDVKIVKPDPELYVKTLQELNLNPTEAIAFEDSLNGLKAAKEAGLHCIIVPNPVTHQMDFEDRHDYRISSMSDEPLASVIDKILS